MNVIVLEDIYGRDLAGETDTSVGSAELWRTETPLSLSGLHSIWLTAGYPTTGPRLGAGGLPGGGEALDQRGPDGERHGVQSAVPCPERTRRHT